jgi:integrase
MSGNIRRRGERSWELKFDAGTDPATGRRKTRYVSFKGTKAEAQREMVRLLSAEQNGLAVDPSRVTVAEFFERWERDWASVNLSPKTWERYGELIRKHIVPRVGKFAVQKLRPANLSELYAALLREAGLAPRTVGHVHRVLHRALGHALQWNVVTLNAAGNVSPPKVEAQEIEILKPEQARTILDKLAGRSFHPIAVMALATGMRRGELLALRWQDVDLDGAQVRVERSLEQTKQGLRFKSPKTRHGRRNIALPAFAVEALRAHRNSQGEMRLKLGMGKAPGDALVFATFDGNPRSPNSVTKEWKAAAKAVGIPVTFHALRHTHASQLIASGMDVLTISRRLGHGSPTITLGVYGHMFANTDDRAAKVMDTAFSAARTE